LVSWFCGDAGVLVSDMALLKVCAAIDCKAK